MRATLTLLALCVALGLSTLYFALETSTARGERDDFAAKLEASELRTQRLQRSVLAGKAKADASRQRLKEATDANPEDRDAPVPVPVRDSLCSTLRCK